MNRIKPLLSALACQVLGLANNLLTVVCVGAYLGIGAFAAFYVFASFYGLMKG